MSSIKMDGAGFSTAYVLSFKTQTAFVKATCDKYFTWKSLTDRKKTLALVYKLAKKSIE